MRKLSLNTGAGMSRQSKTAPQAKKVMPPAVPDIYGKVGSNIGTPSSADRSGEIKHSTTLSSTVAFDTPDGEARNGAGRVAGTITLEHHKNGTEGSSGAGTTVSVVTTAAPSSLLLRCGGDVVVDYVMDDQGIDLTQSPGRDSPVSLSGSAGSGSRHSTASLDSGRASSYLTGASNSSNRSVSGVGSYGVLSSPRCSVSSCSIGSGSGTGGGGGVNSGSVGSASHRLSNHSSGNNRCDHDVISDWLMEIHFQEYTYLFLDAGYDLSTIARMTPEDLTAIGIRKPNHRERLKRHIDALKLPDPLPGYVPGSIEEWLRLLRLDEYIQPLLAQGYQTVHDVTQLTWEDLEDIGIVKLGHQKKILLAIKRVKDIINGKMMGGNGGSSAALSAFMSGPSPTVARSPAVGATIVRSHYDDMSIGLRSESSKQQHLAVSGSYSTFLRQQPPLTGGTGAEAIYYAQQQQQHSTVAQVHHHQTITYPHVHFDGTHAVYRRSSYDDSDITPTNEKTSALLALSGTGGDEQQYSAHGSVLSQQQQHQQWLLHTQKQLQQQQSQTKPPQYFQGGGTLPRQHQRNSYGVRLTLLGGSNQATQRQRPIAKIVANNLKLPGAASAGGGVSPAIDAGSSGMENSPSGIGVGGPPGYPAEVPLPSILGHIENVEMATAALDAMHFSNYTSLPYAAVQHHQHHAALSFSSGTGDEPSGSPSANVGYVGGPAPSIAIQQQQPIYHNQNMMHQHHTGTLQLQGHHYTHSSSSSQSTPSPPTMPTNSVAMGIGVGQHPHSMAPFVSGVYAGQTHQTTVEVHKVSTHHDNKSNSSLESIDQIPFANENAGTIKQRSSLNRTEHQFQHQQQQQHHAQLLPTPLSSSSTSSSSSSLAGSLITTTTASALVTGCLSQELSPSATGSASLTAVTGANPTGSSVTTLPPSGTSSVGLSGPTGACPAESGAPSEDIYGTNVLNDIGNMLANLTDELDAMLEEEKCAGISDIE
uniref:SAM domain-containing protein n=1 Tax=Anopheles atroparvus TaxID=41427 RepID=A0AAG5DWP0_ANOAO